MKTESSPASSPAYFRRAAAAQYVNIPHTTFRQRTWRRRHRVPEIKIGRLVLFSRTQLDHWLIRHASEPVATAGEGR